MTDLEKHVNRPGRDKLVKKVREKINELGITYIYYQFISVTGRVVGKGIPADHWERTAEKGFQLVYGATANLFLDRHNNYIGYGPEAMELVGIPDPETFCQLPWDKRVGRVFVTCFRNREERQNPGGHLTSDCRGNLRIFMEEFEKKHGLELRVGTEPEMMWLTKNEDGTPTGKGFSKPFCYHIDQFESLRPVFMKVIKYSKAMGASVDLPGGKKDFVKMGSYGIGVSRLVGAIIEAKYDDKNEIMKWPLSVAPYDIALIPMINKNDTSALDKANNINIELIKNNVDAIIDDTDENFSSKIKKMNLIGAPYQIIIGKKSEGDLLEFKETGGETQNLPLSKIIEIITKQKNSI